MKEKRFVIEFTESELKKLNSVLMAVVLTFDSEEMLEEASSIAKIGLKVCETLKTGKEVF